VRSMPLIWRPFRQLADSVEALVSLWQQMQTEKVYRTGLGPMMGRMAHWGLHFVSGGRLGRKDHSRHGAKRAAAVVLRAASGA
jgi:hypothetical protein